jgi:E3 ubiquitin-protein ligase HUWE1
MVYPRQFSDASSADSKANPLPTAEVKKILGKSTGYLNDQESQKALVFCCQFIKLCVPTTVMQAVLQLIALDKNTCSCCPLLCSKPLRDEL